jgi:general secretion pathway protein M
MKAWWQQRTARERLVIGAGALMTLLALTWALLWQPMTRQQTALQSRLATHQNTMALLQEARSLRRAQSAKPADGATLTAAGNRASLPVMVDRGLRMGGLAASIRSIQPVGENQLTVTLEGAPFDQLVAWLERAAREQSVFVIEASMDRGASPGSVNARLTVQADG